ncbi:SIR2 family protein [Kribbella monticola]|uniref:SIR2 family protein n=1 Tax=Kribbella monticola TaxID=2185285 RepID=UPI000DD4EC41|nr:SIR2 family protein [Kribbella monticola]
MTRPSGHKEKRLYQIADLPFLERDKVVNYIEEVAGSRRIVIFAGAGVTIDQTGMTWAGLIEKLLEDKALVPSEIVRPETVKAAARLRPVEAATVLKYAADKHGHPTGAIPRAMVSKLYHPSDWNDGGLSTEVACLALDLASKGAEVVVATTNYEILIEQSLLRVWGLSDHRPTFSVTVQDKPFEKHVGTTGSGSVRLEYLHGRVDQQGNTRGVIAVDELDYWGLQARVSKILTRLCKDREMLIVGSSLSDVPLLAALANTLHVNKRHRIALMPVVALGIHEEYEAARVQQTIELLHMRMSAYRVELLVPDFFGEVAQFIREVRRCIRIGPAGATDVNRSRHVQSLHSWWRSWVDQKSASVDDGHRELAGALKVLREVLATHTAALVDAGTRKPDAATETLRLEAWVRWHPIVEMDRGVNGDDSERKLVEQNRDLTFWASSASVLRDPSVQRRVPISVQSRYVSVKALTMGKPLVWHLPPFSPSTDRSKDEAGFGRWRSFFAVPIHAQPPGQGGLTVPVGVITLSSLEARETSAIRDELQACMTGLLAELRAVGSRLFYVQA